MVDEAKKVGISENQVVDWQSKAINQLSFNVPDFWFMDWFFLGIPMNWLLLGMLLLSGLVVLLGWKLRAAIFRIHYSSLSEA